MGINIPATTKTEESKEVIKRNTIQSVKNQTNADRNHLSTVNNEQNNKTEVPKTLRPKDRLKVKLKDTIDISEEDTQYFNKNQTNIYKKNDEESLCVNLINTNRSVKGINSLLLVAFLYQKFLIKS